MLPFHRLTKSSLILPRSLLKKTKKVNSLNGAYKYQAMPAVMLTICSFSFSIKGLKTY